MLYTDKRYMTADSLEELFIAADLLDIKKSFYGDGVFLVPYWAVHLLMERNPVRLSPPDVLEKGISILTKNERRNIELRSRKNGRYEMYNTKDFV